MTAFEGLRNVPDAWLRQLKMNSNKNEPMLPMQLDDPSIATPSYLGIVSISCGAASLGLLAVTDLAHNFGAVLATHPQILSIVESTPLILLAVGFISGGIGCFTPRDLPMCFVGLLVNLFAGVALLTLFLNSMIV